jgi:hypothetical protein
MQHIDLATLTEADAHAYLDQECIAATRAELAAGLATGATRRRFMRYAATHRANAIALSNHIYGEPSPDLLSMSDDELLAALEA